MTLLQRELLRIRGRQDLDFKEVIDIEIKPKTSPDDLIIYGCSEELREEMQKADEQKLKLKSGKSSRLTFTFKLSNS